MTVLDLSAYQPNIDYEKVKQAGVDGVILRCGITYWGKQVCEADRCFEQHYKGFKAAGVPVGAYYYSAADSKDSALREAAFVLSILKGKQLELPVYYDIECEPRMGKLSRKELTEIAKTFCSVLEKAEWFTGVYANTNYFRNKLDHGELAGRYTLWLADYRGSKADQELKRDIWQYTSTGRVDGIDGHVDKNECYRDFPPIIRKAGLNGYKAAAQGNARTYTVKKGDSFWKIAANELGSGVKMYALARANGMSIFSVIHPGQVLRLP